MISSLQYNSVTMYIEAVVSGMFGAGNNGLINPPDPNRWLTVSQADIAVFDDDVSELLMDLTVLIEQAKVHTFSPHGAFSGFILLFNL